jgi:hypothetical protein
MKLLKNILYNNMFMEKTNSDVVYNSIKIK